MGLNQKYGDCGCGQRTRGNPNYGLTSCCGRIPQTVSVASQQGFCNGTPQAAPSPCCEAHETRWRTGICYRPVANVVATTGEFFLTFENNQCNDIVPLNASEMFFYHAAAGFMRILGFNGNSYQVRLVDETRAGAVIQAGDCVYPSAQMNPTGLIPSISRCLSGYFTAPGLNLDADIYILNGSGIPIGAVITFTAEGETGSYEVKNFVSASGSIYNYTVTNTGAGHVPGTIFNGGDDGSCTIPIEVISDVDICNLSTSLNADTLTACVNGSPRAIEAQGEGYALVGTADNKWIQQRLNNTDCCVITDGVLKFSTSPCPGGYDQVVLRDVNLDCFEEAYALAVAAQEPLPMTVEGVPVIITLYDSGTRLATISLASNAALVEPIEFPAGTQICIGSCCKSCTNGDFVTPSEVTPVVSLALPVDIGESYWLVGYNNLDGSIVSQELDAGYWAASQSNIVGLPRFDDPMALRQKICNTSPDGCDQKVNLFFNYQLSFGLLGTGAYIDWEIGHLAQDAATLSNNITPNPFSQVLTLTKNSGRIFGIVNNQSHPTTVSILPSYEAEPVPSSFFTGFKGSSKNIPNMHGTMHDSFNLSKCNCVLSIVWLMFRLYTPASGSIDVQLYLKRSLEYKNYNYKPLPTFPPVSQGFNV